ncbi:MAG: ribonuclease catalytic domain-containing protein [SAR202 cluster bacterium]|jgi:exoribonuclease-2|nr:ribonuclease catalytic domain-containing protein [SAR202 cluster bacterium]MDP6664722.1 ribonuclease catalytic domain-containing protein [SAR202 cluster bacterium]MDP6800579.1 ribonuclease catalytic domain-containing protein [SAR202 cluster bacterium]|tara:strand:+ start:2280 stop:4304 length:2025 start_codon:yes stop_codon:yes gene_type:complete
MNPGDILVVQLSGGPGLGRCVDMDTQRVRIAIGRNREARLPFARVLLETGLSASSHDEVEALTQEAEAVAARVDLEELWDIVCDDEGTMSLSDVAELYWSTAPTPGQIVGLLLHLSRDDLRFAKEGAEYAARSREEVAEMLARRLRRERNRIEGEELASELGSGKMPDEPSAHQTNLLEQLRGLVLYGDDYTRAGAAKKFLQSFAPGARDPRRAAYVALTTVGFIDEDECLDLERASIPVEFDDAVVAEANALVIAPPLETPGRRDLTHLEVVTIDDKGTRDRDDGLSIEVTEADDGSGDVYKVGIHITDAGSVVERESALDVEADRRMSTLYLPERTISMLPPSVSADKGSLNPGLQRAALSVLARLDSEGKVLDWEVASSVVESRAALPYEEVDAALTDPDAPMHESLTALEALSRALRAQRESAGALNLERDELSIKVSPDGDISVRVVARAAPARSMVAEYMILCNSLLADYCKQNKLPAPYRSQKAPDVRDVIAQTPEGPLRWYTIVRKMAPATINTEPGAHGGLGVPAYIQASSPLRRYPDLVVQRQISHFLGTGEHLYDDEAIASVAQRADVQIRELGRLEEQRRTYWLLKYLDRQRRELEEMGEESLFDAMVLENAQSRSGSLELNDYPFRVRAALPSTAAPGETVTLRLHGVDLWRRVGQFVVAQ